MKSTIAIFICIISSFIATFFLFAIAFNTSFSELRVNFLPIYLALILLCLIAAIIAIIAQGRVATVVISALTLPVLMLIFIALQNPSYFAEILLLIALSFVASFAAKIATRGEVSRHLRDAPIAATGGNTR